MKGKPKKYVPNERIDSIIRAHYLRRLENGGHPRSLPTCAEIGAKIGWPKWRVCRRAIELGLARLKEPVWSDEELEVLARYAYLTPPSIQRRLRGAGYVRSLTGIHIKLNRTGLRQTTDFYSALRLASLMGVDIHVVSRWIRTGQLKAKRKGTDRIEVQGGDIYLIRDDWVREFVLAHPMQFDIRRVEQLWFMNMVTDGKTAGVNPG